MIVEYKVLDAEFVKKLNVPYPMYATEGSAGMDLRANLGVHRLSLFPGAEATINTGLAVWIRNPWIMGMVVPRSSLGTRGLQLLNTVGIIDSDYQGELMLRVRNAGQHTLVIEDGERIAQLCLVNIECPTLKQMKEFSEDTTRGTGGFGSTGKS